MPVNTYTPGINFIAGLQVANPFPLDAYAGPYPGGSTTAARNFANDTILPANRYQGMQVILLAPDAGNTVAYKYWYRGGTANTDLVEFSAGGGGAAFDATQSYTWTAPQYFSSGFSAAGGVTFTTPVSFLSGFSAGGGVTFTSLARFTAGLSASGATVGLLVVANGISANSGSTFSNIKVGSATVTKLIIPHYYNNPTPVGRIPGEETGLGFVTDSGFGSFIPIIRPVPSIQGSTQIATNEQLRTNLALGFNSFYDLDESVTNLYNIGLGNSAGAGFSDISNSIFIGVSASSNTNNQTNQIVIGHAAIGDGSNSTVIGNSNTTSTRVYGLLSTNAGISSGGGATFTNDVYVGGTLEVQGNFYVAGTLTTVNETQLLIQDKYLVLGSTFNASSQGTSAGIYIGSTTNPFASFAYNDSGVQRWVSNKPIYVNTDPVLTSATISSQTGITAAQIRILDTENANTDFDLLISYNISESGSNFVYADITDPDRVRYNPSTSTLTVKQVEAIIDGGTWTG